MVVIPPMLLLPLPFPPSTVGCGDQVLIEMVLLPPVLSDNLALVADEPTAQEK